MVTRWHLLHLPVKVQGKTGPWAWVDDIFIRWPDAVIEGISVRTAVSRRFISARDLQVSPMALMIGETGMAQKKPRQWWGLHHGHGLLVNQAVCDSEGHLLGRIKDFVIDENSLAVHHIVVSRGLLEDLMQGSLLIPAHQLQLDNEGRIKIAATGAI